MPLSKARNRQRMRLERKAAKMAHWGLFLKWKEASDSLEKAISPPQTSKAVQPITINNSLDFTIEDCRFTEIDADGNVIPDYE